MNSVNPDIHETRKLTAIAKEIIDSGMVELDWSELYGTTIASVNKFAQLVASSLCDLPVSLMKYNVPLFVDYMLEECCMDAQQADWHSIAIAVDNINGMCHPLQLTKIVMDRADDN